MFNSLDLFKLSKITDQIYLSSEVEARNLKQLKDNKISHILVVGSELSIFHPSKFEYLQIALKDLKKEPIKDTILDSIMFVEKAIGQQQENRVLVHCKMGASRSVSVVICYIMVKWNRSFQDAFKMVKSLRKQASPNQGFVKFMSNSWAKCVSNYYQILQISDSK